MMPTGMHLHSLHPRLLPANCEWVVGDRIIAPPSTLAVAACLPVHGCAECVSEAARTRRQPGAPGQGLLGTPTD